MADPLDQNSPDLLVEPALKTALRKLRHHAYWGGEKWWVPALKEEMLCLTYSEAIALHRLLAENDLAKPKA